MEELFNIPALPAVNTAETVVTLPFLFFVSVWHFFFFFVSLSFTPPQVFLVATRHNDTVAVRAGISREQNNAGSGDICKNK